VNTEAAILEMAHAAGFDLAGITPLAPPADAERFAAWLDDGLAADMDWLERNRGRIMDPRGLAEEPASLLVVGLAHSRAPFELLGGGRIARYAVGRDYHNRIGKDLKRLAKALDREGLLRPGRAGRAMTDAAPLLERSHAASAGIGFGSKAANLLNPAFGPWFSIGELVLRGDFEALGTAPGGSCGTCTACLDACPTAALLEPGRVDAGRCISYQTIENRGPVPHELRDSLSGWVFGCDICSEVCPWGKKAPDRSAEWGLHEQLESGLAAWLTQDEGSFKERWRGSPVQRPYRAGLARNAALVLGLQPVEKSGELLRGLLRTDPSAMVREAAAWALARGHAADRGVASELEAALEREPDPAMRALLQRDLALAVDTS
jgi:epoxyqueuosine reductase